MSAYLKCLKQKMINITGDGEDSVKTFSGIWDNEQQKMQTLVWQGYIWYSSVEDEDGGVVAALGNGISI